MLSARDIREFRGFLQQATDRQVQGIYDKERRAGRDDYAELAVAEAERRGIFLDETEGDHATMLRFPRWRVDVKVDGNLVKTFHETATTGEAAINKAKHKMRGAVSSAGTFKFTAKKVDDDAGRQHATRRKSPAQLDREIADALRGSARPKIDLMGTSVKKIAGRWQPMSDTGYEILYDDLHNRDHAGYSTREEALAALHEMLRNEDARQKAKRGRTGHATVGGSRSFLAPGVIRPGDRVTIVDRFGVERTGRAVMRGPHGWVLNMGGKHGTPGIATDENIVSVKSPGLKGLTAKKTGHATRIKIPGVTKWNTYAGGTGAAEGKHSYDLHVPEGQYTISPYTRSGGRHAGYLLKFAATGGRPRGSHGGLWHDLGSHASPQKAASAAAKHYAGGFE